ncbi:Hypothetical protein, putative [Bodo saltans]|uniref:Uncharacterized protein n=1 Tax=Bodo saltans TaxID=75058 RepID=A0A0S4JPG2_BODSA|nr:Hypothetical protein, putative [Bodo saltans]|eukprot:CUG92581.1 Hypothetical protein, putative [Bodo saltans]
MELADLETLEPAERQVLETEEAQHFAAFNALDAQQKTMFMLSMLSRQLLVSQDRQRRRIEVEALLAVRQLALMTNEVVGRVTYVANDEARSRSRLLLQASLHLEQSTERSEERLLESSERYAVQEREALERRALLVHWCLTVKQALTITILNEERISRVITIEGPHYWRKQLISCGDEEYASRRALDSAALVGRIALMADASVFLLALRTKHATAVSEITGAEADFRRLMTDEEQLQRLGLCTDAVHSEHVAALVAMLTEEIALRKEVQREFSLNTQRSRLAQEESDARRSFQGREAIIRSAASNDIFDKVYFWTESHRQVASEARHRGSLVRFVEPLARVGLGAVITMLNEMQRFTSGYDAMCQRFQMECCLLTLQHDEEPQARMKLFHEEERSRARDLTNAAGWKYIRTVELAQWEYECREEVVEEWESESNELETWLLQRLIRLTNDAMMSASERGGNGRMETLAAANNSLRSGHGGGGVDAGGELLFASSFTAESDKLFVKNLIEQEEFPRQKLHRIEHTEFIDMVSQCIQRGETVQRQQMLRAYDLDFVGIKWKSRSKQKVLLRTGALYDAEFRQRTDLEELAGRLHITMTEAFTAWRLLKLDAPRSYLHGRALESKHALQHIAAMERIVMVEHHYGAALEECERVAFRRLVTKHQVHGMVTLGSAGRRQITDLEHQHFLVDIREPHERWLLEKRIASNFVGNVESFVRANEVMAAESKSIVQLLEEPLYRRHLTVYEELSARNALLPTLEELARRWIAEQSTCAVVLLSKEHDQSALWSHQQHLRRAMVHGEQLIMLRLKESFSRKTLVLREIHTFHQEFAHLPKRMKVLLEEHWARQELDQVFRFVIDEPQRRSHVAAEQERAFFLLKTGEGINRTVLGAFFEKERNARKKVALHEEDDWEAVGLSQRFRRSSIRRSVPLPFKPPATHDPIHNHNMNPLLGSPPTKFPSPQSWNVAVEHNDAAAAAAAAPMEQQTSNKLYTIMSITDNNNLSSPTDALIMIANNGVQQGPIVATENSTLASHASWCNSSTPIDASKLEDAEVLIRLQILRHEDQATRQLFQLLKKPVNAQQAHRTPTKPMFAFTSPNRPHTAVSVTARANIVASNNNTGSAIKDGVSPSSVTREMQQFTTPKRPDKSNQDLMTQGSPRSHYFRGSFTQ